MTGRFTRILVPTDFGAASEAALANAKELAARLNARLYLLHAVEDPMVTAAWSPDVYITTSAELRDRLLRDAKQRLDEALAAEDGERLTWTIEVRVGAAAHTIGAFAREKTIDLIVMGTHGRRGLSHMFLGSVAEQLVRTAPCPVLTVRADHRTQVAFEAAQAVAGA